MRRNIITAILYTLVTTIIFGVAYPLLVTGAAQLLFKDKANGQLITENGTVVGSHLIGQSFSAPAYFHSRPSVAGNGYDHRPGYDVCFRFGSRHHTGGC